MSKPKGERYTVAVDFDGVIHSYSSPWVSPEVIPDPPVEGAIEWLNGIIDHFDMVIFTTRGRTAEGRGAVRRWLEENGAKGAILASLVTSDKQPALIYLDDRAYRFEGPGTFPTKEQIHAARPWNKR